MYGTVNDELYTLDYAVKPIIKYLSPNQNIWLPFDTQESQFYIQLKKAGFNNLITSHISEGKDFYTYTPDRFDVIVSNPPFSGKKEMFQRCLGFNKPFAMIMSLTWLNDTTPFNLFGDKLQLLIFKQRMEFIDGQGELMAKPTFKSAYFCYNLLPEKLIFDDLTLYLEEGEKI